MIARRTRMPVALAQTSQQGCEVDLIEATATAETAAGGKVSATGYQIGETGAPDVITAGVTLADGSEKTVAINPADGKVLKITRAGAESGPEPLDCGAGETADNQA